LPGDSLERIGIDQKISFAGTRFSSKFWCILCH